MIIPEINIKKILYATDLSDSSIYAFAYAVSLANHYEAELVILYVLEEDPDLDSRIVTYIGVEQWENIKAQNIEDARGALLGKKRDNTDIREALGHITENVKENVAGKHVVTDEIVVARGNPVDRIIEKSTEKACDVIVMGTHGRKGITAAIIGSTAQRVMKRSQKPVLVVRLPDTD